MIEFMGGHFEREVILRGVRCYMAYPDRLPVARGNDDRVQLANGETCVRVKAAWKHLYRAVDKADATVDFLFAVNGIAKPR
jgi:transposase-like protein